MGVAALATLRLTPYSIHKYTDIVNQLEATQLTADVPSRVFVENFPNTILYVGDVEPGESVGVENIFVADVAPPEKRSSGMRDKAEGPMITVARGGHRGSGRQEQPPATDAAQLLDARDEQGADVARYDRADRAAGAGPRRRPRRRRCGRSVWARASCWRIRAASRIGSNTRSNCTGASRCRWRA